MLLCLYICHQMFAPFKTKDSFEWVMGCGNGQNGEEGSHDCECYFGIILNSLLFKFIGDDFDLCNRQSHYQCQNQILRKTNQRWMSCGMLWQFEWSFKFVAASLHYFWGRLNAFRRLFTDGLATISTIWRKSNNFKIQLVSNAFCQLVILG